MGNQGNEDTQYAIQNYKKEKIEEVGQSFEEWDADRSKYKRLRNTCAVVGLGAGAALVFISPFALKYKSDGWLIALGAAGALLFLAAGVNALWAATHRAMQYREAAHEVAYLLSLLDEANSTARVDELMERFEVVRKRIVAGLKKGTEVEDLIGLGHEILSKY